MSQLATQLDCEFGSEITFRISQHNAHRHVPEFITAIVPAYSSPGQKQVILRVELKGSILSQEAELLRWEWYDGNVSKC